MRIRKAYSTLSDLNMINRSPVVVQLNDATTTSPKLSCTHDLATALLSLSDHPQPSDRLLPPIGKPANGCDDSLSQDKKQEILVEDGRGKVKEGGQKGNDTRNGSILSAQTSTEVFSPSRPSSHKQDWNDGEKAFPLKKRRGSFATNSNNDNNNNAKKKMKTTTNKKCYDSNEWDEEEDHKEEEVVVVRETKQKKKVRGGALMEGSRCSRVNGRGWRCCQPTLVGYSLCEHHLGKGRLRSMTSVRNRSLVAETSSTENPLSQMEPPSLEKLTKFDGEDNDEKKPLIIAKKRMKIGMVKARSMSSLLGQTSSDLVVAENSK